MPPSPSARKHDLPADPMAQAARRHWRSVLILTLSLLIVWFLAGPVLGILLADVLSDFRLGGFPLGFWFAQQGSIIIFLMLIAIYAIAMNRLDRRYHRQLRDVGAANGRNAS